LRRQSFAREQAPAALGLDLAGRRPTQRAAVDATGDEGGVDTGCRRAGDVVLERVADRQQARGRDARQAQAGPVDPRMRLAVIMHRPAHRLIGLGDEARSLVETAIGVDAVAVGIGADHRDAAGGGACEQGLPAGDGLGRRFHAHQQDEIGGVRIVGRRQPEAVGEALLARPH